MMFMLWHVLINSEYLDIASSSSTRINATFLSWFFNIVTRKFRMSRSGHLLLDGNSKGYEVAEHISTKVEVNPWMLSKLKNSKYIWSMNPGENFETSMVGPLVMLSALVKRKIGRGYSESGRFVGRPSMTNLPAIFFGLSIQTRPKHWWIILYWFYFYRSHIVETTIFLFLLGLTFKKLIWR